jgi:hypothetical protein
MTTPIDNTLRIVKTRQGTETHLGAPGVTVTAGHQLPSGRSITFVAQGATDVTCERCRDTDAYRQLVAPTTIATADAIEATEST